MNGDVKVCILEVYGLHPFPLLEGSHDAFWSFHFEFCDLEIMLQSAKIQNWSPYLVGFGNQKKAVEKPMPFFSKSACNDSNREFCL